MSRSKKPHKRPYRFPESGANLLVLTSIPWSLCEKTDDTVWSKRLNNNSAWDIHWTLWTRALHRSRLKISTLYLNSSTVLILDIWNGRNKITINHILKHSGFAVTVGLTDIVLWTSFTGTYFWFDAGRYRSVLRQTSVQTYLFCTTVAQIVRRYHTHAKRLDTTSCFPFTERVPTWKTLGYPGEERKQRVHASSEWSGFAVVAVLRSHPETDLYNYSWMSTFSKSTGKSVLLFNVLKKTIWITMFLRPAMKSYCHYDNLPYTYFHRYNFHLLLVT